MEDTAASILIIQTIKPFSEISPEELIKTVYLNITKNSIPSAFIKEHSRYYRIRYCQRNFSSFSQTELRSPFSFHSTNKTKLSLPSSVIDLRNDTLRSNTDEFSIRYWWFNITKYFIQYNKSKTPYHKVCEKTYNFI